MKELTYTPEEIEDLIKECEFELEMLRLAYDNKLKGGKKHDV